MASDLLTRLMYQEERDLARAKSQLLTDQDLTIPQVMNMITKSDNVGFSALEVLAKSYMEGDAPLDSTLNRIERLNFINPEMDVLKETIAGSLRDTQALRGRKQVFTGLVMDKLSSGDQDVVESLSDDVYKALGNNTIESINEALSLFDRVKVESGNIQEREDYMEFVTDVLQNPEMYLPERNEKGELVFDESGQVKRTNDFNFIKAFTHFGTEMNTQEYFPKSSRGTQGSVPGQTMKSVNTGYDIMRYLQGDENQKQRETLSAWKYDQAAERQKNVDLDAQHKAFADRSINRLRPMTDAESISTQIIPKLKTQIRNYGNLNEYITHVIPVLKKDIGAYGLSKDYRDWNYKEYYSDRLGALVHGFGDWFIQSGMGEDNDRDALAEIIGASSNESDRNQTEKYGILMDLRHKDHYNIVNEFITSMDAVSSTFEEDEIASAYSAMYDTVRDQLMQVREEGMNYGSIYPMWEDISAEWDLTGSGYDTSGFKP